MRIIKNTKELAELVDENKDLFLKEEDIRIEFEPTKEELRDIYCRDLFLMDDNSKFNFNGGNFNGRDFNGWDFNGRDFNGWNFNGWDFNGWDFNGRDFNGGDFNGWDFNGGNFNGRDFNGGNFNGRDFNGGNFNGRDFNGWDISYYGWFIVYKDIKCKSIKGRREKCFYKCLDGTLIIKKEEKPAESKKVRIRLADNQIVEGEIVD